MGVRLNQYLLISNLKISKMEGQIFSNSFINQLAKEVAKELTPLLIPQTTNEPKHTENDLITRKELRTLLSINYTTIWKHSKSGKFQRFGIGNKVFYSRKQVLEAVKPLQV